MVKLSTRDGCYDNEILREVRQHYYPERLPYATFQRVIDVGAHIGGFTAFVKEQAPKCTVRAVEQDGDNYHMLLHNVGYLSKVSVYHARCQYVPATEKWLNLRDKRNSGAHTLVRTKQAHHTRPMPEEYELLPACRNIITLETLTRDWKSVDLLKLDCEGCEANILENAGAETLLKFRWIVGEYHVFAGNLRYLFEKRLHQWFDLVEYEDAPNWGHFLLERK